MLTSKFVRENIDLVQTNLKKRNNDLDLSSFLDLEDKRLKLIALVEEKKSRRNKMAKEMGMNPHLLEEELKKEMRQMSQDIQRVDRELDLLQEQIGHFCYSMPNILDPEVPEGIDETGNQVIRTVGRQTEFSFSPRDHVDLLKKNRWSDFDRAAKISGSRFMVLKEDAVRLERALVNFFIDQNLSVGYTELHPPSIVNAQCLLGTGQLPKFKEDLFTVDKEPHNRNEQDPSREKNQLFLIPTAEVPLTNLHSGEILSVEELPKKYTAYTSCFRSEAGAAGKDTKGLFRLHEFGKVELVNLTTPEQSSQALEEMLVQVESILKRLKLPYQVVLLCSGDIGFSAKKCYDLEVWLPGQQAYREISSCSNCGSFQATRANIRFRVKHEKLQFVHTLNGSSLPIGRTLIAILENYQLKDGGIRIPEALVPYFGKEQMGPVS